MMLIKATLMTAFLGLALGDQSPYAPYSENAFSDNHNSFGVRQGRDIDPLTASAGIGVVNAGFTALVGWNNYNHNKMTCNKVNEMLNVADLAAITVKTSNANTDMQADINLIVNKINEILQKSTLHC